MAVTVVAAAAFFAVAPDAVVPFARCSPSARSRPRGRRASSLLGLVARSGPVALNFFTTGRRHDVRDGARGRRVGARRGGAQPARRARGGAARRRRGAGPDRARAARRDRAQRLGDRRAGRGGRGRLRRAARPGARGAALDRARPGRDALAELRRLLEPSVPQADGREPAPQPGLDRLDALAEPLRGGGLDGRVSAARATPASLPAGVDLSAYRIVQEALTNTLRHARATRAEVTVRYARGRASRSTCATTARAAPADGPAAAAGSSACASAPRCSAARSRRGPRPGGGFRVHAGCRWRRAREHPRPARRRPGARPRRLPR